MIGPHLAGSCRKVKVQMLLGGDTQHSTTEFFMGGGEPRRTPPLERMLPKMFEGGRREGISIGWLIAIQAKEAGNVDTMALKRRKRERANQPKPRG
jgi:hypothetical protein